MTLNKVSLIGRLGKDPEIKSGQYGDFVVFSLATTEAWKDKRSGDRKEKTEWHNIVIYNEHLAKVAADWLHKGDQIFLEGKIQTRKWEKDGEDRYTTEIVIPAFGGELKMLGSKKENEDRQEYKEQFGGRTKPKAATPRGRPGANRAGQAPAFQSGGADDDIPF